MLPTEFRLVSITQIASLWSNYGYIHRLYLDSTPDHRQSPSTLILKSIHPPSSQLADDESNVRKLLPYAVERWFYANLASKLPLDVKLAKCYSVQDGQSLLLEDLCVEYPFTARDSLGREASESVVRWLAGFHRTFYRLRHQRGEKDSGEGESLPLVPSPREWKKSGSKLTDGVWKRGTYWYLDTRRDELDETDEEEHGWLLPWVQKVDDAISREIEVHGTLLHGDVKSANILFDRDPYPQRRSRAQISDQPSAHPIRCALYDLQYVGLGLPTHDLVYFLGTSVQASLLGGVEQEKEMLKAWLEAFRSCNVENVEDEQLEYDFDTLWRHWELSIVDWCRFMAG
ncbi:kinase-like domain-containing protein [Cytidiella melzeri]|nr:kinase-like domain-containing protein [Cytidiella melzeri]